MIAPLDISPSRPGFSAIRTRTIWQDVSTWLTMIPLLFISVSGKVDLAPGPVAFRFTAVAEDSLARRLTLVACSLISIFLVSTRVRGVCRTIVQVRRLLILPALAVISAAWSHNPTHTLINAAVLTLNTLFVVYLHVRYPKDALLTFLTGGAAFGLLLSLLAVVFVPRVGIDAYQQDAWRGVFSQKNNCATVCMFFLALAAHLEGLGAV